MAKKTITRVELLNMVWQTPMTELASKYGLSDNGLRKICKKHQIHTPPVGYWAKVKFGKPVPKIPKLKPLENEPSIVLSEKDSEYDGPVSYLSKYYSLAKELKVDQSLDFSIPEKVTRFVEEVRFAKSVINKTHPDSKNFGKYGENRPPYLAISLPKHLINRGYLFYHIFIKNLKARGHKLEIYRRSTEIIIKGISYSVKLNEKQKKVKKENPSWFSSTDLVPSGKLCFFKQESYERKEWVDTERKKIEEKIPEIIAYFELQAQKEIDRQLERKRAARLERKRKRIKANALVRLNSFAKRRKKLKEDELSKVNDFILGFRAWKTANEMRAYLSLMLEKNNTLDQEYAKWVKVKIDWFDPFIEKEDQVLNENDKREIFKSLSNS